MTKAVRDSRDKVRRERRKGSMNGNPVLLAVMGKAGRF
jgi:hypothetical protein